MPTAVDSRVVGLRRGTRGLWNLFADRIHDLFPDFGTASSLGREGVLLTWRA